MDSKKIVIDGKYRKLIFHGNCMETLSMCEAMCCRNWDVVISAEEYASHIYNSAIICALTEKICQNTQPCINRFYRLAKQEDKSCVYLKDNLCSIYSERPKVCRDFVCRSGWRFDTIFSNEDTTLVSNQNISNKKIFVGLLSDDLTFVMHPLIKVHTVFYRKSHRDIIFVKEIIGGKCGKFNTQDCFDYPQLDDEKVMKLIDLFNRKESLESSYKRYCSMHPDLITKNEFFEILWLLNKHNIVLDSRNFRGMLKGMGGLG